MPIGEEIPLFSHSLGRKQPIVFVVFDHSERPLLRKADVQIRNLKNFSVNDWIGPGGWTNINDAHMRWVHKAVDAYKGKRLLVTFGGAHKYWILDALRERDDVELLDVRPFLPPQR